MPVWSLFFCEFAKIFKNTLFTEHWATASDSLKQSENCTLTEGGYSFLYRIFSNASKGVYLELLHQFHSKIFGFC